jgi:uncharacterized protein (DUF302 family)
MHIWLRDGADHGISDGCRPTAHKAILVEENIGLMLPCNLVIYERQNKTVVSIIKPKVAMKMIGNVELEQIASTIEKKLKKVFDSII